jgi:hypothetical protein
VKALLVADHGLVISSAEDGVLLVTDTSAPGPQRMFASDLTPAPIVYDQAHGVIVAGDASGGLHLLPLAPEQV